MSLFCFQFSENKSLPSKETHLQSQQQKHLETIETHFIRFVLLCIFLELTVKIYENSVFTFKFDKVKLYILKYQPFLTNFKIKNVVYRTDSFPNAFRLSMNIWRYI